MDLKNDNKNNSGINLILNTNSSDNKNKKNKNNISIETNLINIKEFKAEKIKIDLTEMDKTSELNMDDKINIKYLNLKTEINENNDKEKNINNNQFMPNKAIKKISKSIPKVAKGQKRMKSDKKLSLNKARYEKKLKYVNLNNQNSDLIYAKSFIDDYKKNKNENLIIDTNKTNIDDKMSVNTEPNIYSIGDKESKCSFIYNQRRNKYKTYNETIDSS